MRKAIFGLIGAGAALLTLAQFMPLYHAHVSSFARAIASETVGGDHAFGVLPLALLALFMGWIIWVSGNRLALLIVVLLGLAALVIGLSHDLPDAHASGIRLVDGHYEAATNVIGFGLYVELLGTLLLLTAGAVGFLLGGDDLGPGVSVNRQKASV